MSDIIKPVIGSFVPHAELTMHEQTLVRASWTATEFAYTPLSNFPVGAMVHMTNDRGIGRNFFGCNVENRFMSCTICAERNAITTAVAGGYRNLKELALVLKNYQGPGASPCGPCRQVMIEFGRDAIVLQAANKARDVARYVVRDLLPAASGPLRALASLKDSERKRIERVLSVATGAYAPYSKKPRAAIFTATAVNGSRRSFVGVTDDNSAYGGSAAAETIAMRSARTAGYVKQPVLTLQVDDPKGLNPVEGGSLQVLREFGSAGTIVLVGADASSVVSSTGELLPDSFGPESLD